MHDVVIVGGGPVGMVLASLLAVRGIDVEVLEQRAEPSMRSRAIGIHPPAIAALARIGVADEVIARAVQIGSGEVRCDGRTLGRLSFAKAKARYPFVVALPQYETEALLRKRFDELRPGGLRGGVTVVGVHERGDHLELETERDGTVEARFVVAADGARSRVRTAVGIGWLERGHGETYLMGDYADTGIDTGDYIDTGTDTGTDTHADEYSSIAVLFFERGGVVESFPLPNARRRWVAMTDGLATDATSADLAAIIRSRTGVDLPLSTDQPSAFAVHQRLADRMIAGRVALVGDAAHEISPIGGQGMNLGWLDAVALAPALERALSEPHSAADAAASVLADYDRRRRRAARMAARQADFNMAMGRPANGLRLHARNALVRTLAVPPVRGILVRAFTMRWL